MTQGDLEVLSFLNDQLTTELTAIHQFGLHSKMQEHRGWTRICSPSRARAVDGVGHAELLTARILVMEGTPNVQRLFQVHIGQSVGEMFQADRLLLVNSIDQLGRGIEVMLGKGDATSSNLFKGILEDSKRCLDYLDTQLELIGAIGESLYLEQTS